MPYPDHPPAESYFPEKHTLDAFAAAAEGCRACPLWADASQAVFGEGPASARLMLIGEMPGDSEDKEGRPFVGSSGRLLDELLAEVGLDRTQVYVTNVVKHFKFKPRGKRRIHETPTMTEVGACMPCFLEEVELVEPEMIVCLGSTAARAVIGSEVRIRRDHGEVFATEHADWTMPTSHPSAALRAPAKIRGDIRQTLTEDLARAAEELQKQG
jgi:DNA polymerase